MPQVVSEYAILNVSCIDQTESLLSINADALATPTLTHLNHFMINSILLELQIMTIILVIPILMGKRLYSEFHEHNLFFMIPLFCEVRICQ